MNITGTIIQAGNICDNDGAPVTGLLIECTREALMAGPIPLYEAVTITPVEQTPPPAED
jgi:hypothetical protein